MVIDVWVKTADGDIITKPVNYKTVGEAISHEESLGNKVFAVMSDKDGDIKDKNREIKDEASVS